MKRYAGLLALGLMGAACSEPGSEMNDLGGSPDMSVVADQAPPPDLAPPADLLQLPKTLALVAGGLGGTGNGDGIGTAARFNSVRGVAADSAGNLYVMDTFNNTLRKVAAGTGEVTTVAGSPGVNGGIDGVGAAARFNNPYGVTVDGAGNVYVADSSSHTIRKVVVATGTVTTLVGTTGMTGTADGTGAAARFMSPYGVVVDAAGANLYVADTASHTIRKVVIATGVVTTLAGTASMSGNTNATGAAARFREPSGLALDAAGNLYVSEPANHTIRKVVVATGVVTTLAGTTAMMGSTDGTGAAARFSFPFGLAVDAAGNLYVADRGNTSLRKIVAATGEVTTLAGGGMAGNVDGTGAAARFDSPYGVAADGAGNLYVADTSNHQIRKVVAATGVVTTAAGSGLKAGSADGTGAAARFSGSGSVTPDGAGNLYVTDTTNHTIRKVVAATGVVTTIAGTAGSFGGTDGTGSAARFTNPAAGALDGAGNLYIADGSNTIRKVVVSTGVVTTVAGTAGSSGSADGTGAAARFQSPGGLALDAQGGNLYVSDTSNHTLRKVVLATGVVTTLAGTVSAFGGGADGTGAAAQFARPLGLVLDGTGNLYVADSSNHAIRKVVVSTGVVTTVAGTLRMSGGADGTGAAVRFNTPTGVALDAAGNLYASDSFNSAVRKVDLASGTVTTYIGAFGQTGVRLGQLPARLSQPRALTGLPSGELYIFDEGAVIALR